ncbi:MAG TPA: choice-of-anchor Q domain-containing protein [Polyangiaceae bacterium]|nr:choice-of-anchor Q domain-containing protein [Polyangiaceae bacterium]
MREIQWGVHARAAAWMSSLVIVVACGSSSSGGAAGPKSDGGDSSPGDMRTSGDSGGMGNPGGSDGSSATMQGGGDGGADAGLGAPTDASPPGLIDAPSVPAALACSPPFGAADTSTPTTVVGNGSGGCTEAALVAAVEKGGVVTFNCGAPTTIQLTAQLEFPKGKDTTLDGGGSVTLDGGGTTRIVHFDGGGYRTTSTVITLQNLTFQNGLATGTKLASEPAPCSQGYDTDAGGGAVFVNDGVLHVVGCTFTGNAGQTPGPDVAGGGIYVDGSKSTVIIGSRFADNTASNGGAVGSLNSDLSIYTSTMSGNTATGTGQNNTSSKCTSSSTEIGDGGSGGAVYMDGGQDGNTIFCGDVFSKNHANALGGAVFRVFDDATHDLDLDVSTVDGNVADGPVGTDGDGPGAGAFYVHNANVNVNNTTISNNQSPGCGGFQVDGSTLNFSNVTLSGNVAIAGVGGAICVFSNGGTLTNCTLSGNQANGGTSYSNYYGAAIFGGNLTLNDTIVANNTTMNSEGRMQCAATEMGSHDIQWPMNKVVGGSADSLCLPNIDFEDPMLGALSDNGGSTLTMQPAAAASVVQVGTGCAPTDQTGKARANPCTIGALER